MRSCTDPLALDPFSPIGISPIADSSSTTDALALEPLSPPSTGATGRVDWAPDWGPTRTRCAARSGSVAVMNTTDNIHLNRVDVAEEVIADTGGGVRIAEIGLVILLGLLVCPPLLILAVVVAVPVIAISAVVAAVAAAIVVPTMLVRRVLAHHRAHGSTLFLHRVLS
jgi:hypothetical protein